MGGSLCAWLTWIPKPRQEPLAILELASSRTQPVLSTSNNLTATTSTNARVSNQRVSVSSTSQGRLTNPLPRVSYRIPPRNPQSPAEGRPVENLFEAQLALARLGISPGSLDGVIGSRTRNALRAFQQRERLTATTELDQPTRQKLRLTEAPYTNYVVSASDVARLMPIGPTWLAKSEQLRLDYESILELVAERAWSHPNYVRQLNPTLNWDAISPGTSVLLPNVQHPPIKEKAAFARIQLANRTLQVFDAQVQLIAHFPCSVARNVDSRPAGELRVDVIVPDPNYTFDPERFPGSAEARQLQKKLILPPGPNNPVGTVWIGLDKPGYGIHGTSQPEHVGTAESMGCFRLANWNAEFFLELSWIGMPVHVEP
jgi:lipoprotein-anchoring transpeptidase ErfK/SrfK